MVKAATGSVWFFPTCQFTQCL